MTGTRAPRRAAITRAATAVLFIGACTLTGASDCGGRIYTFKVRNETGHTLHLYRNQPGADGSLNSPGATPTRVGGSYEVRPRTELFVGLGAECDALNDIARDATTGEIIATLHRRMCDGDVWTITN